MRWLMLFTALCVLAFPAHAKRFHTERWYQDKHCKGIIEYRLPDKTRVDCLVGGYAIEYDFANKWAEGIGQALYYSIETDRNAGLVLIFESQKDCRHLPKFTKTNKGYWLNIDIELIGPDGDDGIKEVTCS